jgi:hypothetical protein
MTRSRASSIASTSTLSTAHVIDYNSPFLSSTSAADNLSAFHSALQSYGNNNERKALLSALIETSTNKNNDEASPNSIFIAVQSALSSLTSSLEKKLSCNEGGEKEVATVVALLELLRRMVSFVVFWGNNEGALFGEIISMSLC